MASRVFRDGFRKIEMASQKMQDGFQKKHLIRFIIRILYLRCHLRKLGWLPQKIEMASRKMRDGFPGNSISINLIFKIFEKNKLFYKIILFIT